MPAGSIDAMNAAAQLRATHAAVRRCFVCNAAAAAATANVVTEF